MFLFSYEWNDCQPYIEITQNNYSYSYESLHHTYEMTPIYQSAPQLNKFLGHKFLNLTYIRKYIPLHNYNNYVFKLYCMCEEVVS